MTKLNLLPFTLIALLFVHQTLSLSSDPPQSSPSPTPQLPADAPFTSSPSPAPSPSDIASPAPAASDISHGNANVDGEKSKDDSSGGLNGGQKAGIVIGVIACAFVVGFGGMMYKKRQQNIRRSQFGYAARREIL